MAAFGLVPEGDPVPAPQVFHLWPENQDAWNLFMWCGGRWRYDMGEREGLDLPGCEIVMRARGVRRRDWNRRIQDLLVMERAALEVWAERARAKAARS